jgi:hypothetical protein
MTTLRSALLGAALLGLALGAGCASDDDPPLGEVASAIRDTVIEIGPDLETVAAWSPERIDELRREAAQHGRALVTQAGDVVERVGGLDKLDADGNPALHYAVVEVSEPRQVAALARLGLHVEMEPLFGEERVVSEHPHIAVPSGDARGVLAFVIVPALTFELLLEARAQGLHIFEWMLLRELPRDDAGDGVDPSRFNWAYLERGGLEWHPLPEERVPPLSEREIEEQAAWLDALDRVATEHAPWIDPARATFAPRALRDTNVSVEVVPFDNDVSFVVQSGGPPRATVRAWGNARGGRVDLREMPVIAKATGFALNRRGKLGDQNRAYLELDEDRSYQLCVELDTPGGKVRVLPPFSANICAGGTIDPDSATSFVAQVQHTYMTILVQASEGLRWLQQIAGYDYMHTAKVLVGGYADLLAGSAAYAPCASLFKARNVPGIGDLARIFYHHDVVMPGPVGDEFNRSRAGFSHEYGHVVLCNLIYQAAYVDTPAPPPASTQENNFELRFEWAWQDMIIQTAATPAIDKEAVWINEGFADFIASQVAGGVNYHEPNNTFTSPSSFMHMCDAKFDDCMEENETFPANFVAPSGPPSVGFDAALAAWVSLLHDVVDGQLPAVGAGAYNNGAAWKLRRDAASGLPIGGMVPGAFDAPRQNDEMARLSRGGLFQIMLRWIERSGNSPTLRKDSMLGAIADALRDEGLPEAQICRLFELHLAPANSCLAVGGGVDLGLDASAVAEDEGDMLAPAALRCVWPTRDQLSCSWEDASLDGYVHIMNVQDAATGFVVDEIERPFEIYAGASMTLVEHPDITAVRVSVRARQVGGDLGPATTVVFTRPEAPLTGPGCGDGVIEGDEECDHDGLVIGPPTACPLGCFAIESCLECHVAVDCECGAPGP